MEQKCNSPFQIYAGLLSKSSRMRLDVHLSMTEVFMLLAAADWRSIFETVRAPTNSGAERQRALTGLLEAPPPAATSDERLERHEEEAPEPRDHAALEPHIRDVTHDGTVVLDDLFSTELTEEEQLGAPERWQPFQVDAVNGRFDPQGIPPIDTVRGLCFIKLSAIDLGSHANIAVVTTDEADYIARLDLIQRDVLMRMVRPPALLVLRRFQQWLADYGRMRDSINFLGRAIGNLAFSQRGYMALRRLFGFTSTVAEAAVVPGPPLPMASGPTLPADPYAAPFMQPLSTGRRARGRPPGSRGKRGRGSGATFATLD